VRPWLPAQGKDNQNKQIQLFDGGSLALVLSTAVVKDVSVSLGNHENPGGAQAFPIKSIHPRGVDNPAGFAWFGVNTGEAL